MSKARSAISRAAFVRGSVIGMVGALAAEALSALGIAEASGEAGASGGGIGARNGSISEPAIALADDLQKLRVGHLNSTAHLLAFVAKQEGFYEDEGLDVELVQFSSGPELVAGLESGKLDVVLLGSVPTLVNQSGGHEISIFGGAMSNGHGIVVKSKYTDGLDEWDVTILRGLTLAVPLTSIQELETLQILEEYGLTYSEDGDADVRIVYFASQADAYNALASDEIDAVTTYSPYMSRAVEEGHSIVYNCSDEEVFENQPCCRQVALTSALVEERERFVRFERAMIKAFVFYRTEPERTIADVHEYIPIDEGLIEFELYSGDYAESNPDPGKRATLALKDGAVEFGYLEDYDIEPLFNTDIYLEALTSLLEDDPGNELLCELRERFDELDA